MYHLRNFVTKYRANEKYYKYVKYSFLTNVCVSAESALTTHNMLQAIGSCPDTIRTANYIGKDVIGQLGALWYMTKMSTKADKNPSKFLIMSHVLQQVSFFSVFLTPIFPSYFLVIAGVSNILANISFTGYGAMTAKAIQTLSIPDNNIGELYTKITVINTLGSSIGLIAGIGINTVIPSLTLRLLIAGSFAAARIYTFDQSMKVLSIV
jgi:hypothetical protein